MPGWHNATAALRKARKFEMLGIVQEQHGARCHLFMQWKNMRWPVMVDSLGLLGVPVVPITLAIDEHGIIRHTGLRKPDAKWLEDNFLKMTYEKPPNLPPRKTDPALASLKSLAERNPSAETYLAYANAAALEGSATQIDVAIPAYQRTLRYEGDNAETHFKLGVAYRKRYDSKLRRAGDFQKAVEHWSRAIELEPNNYIWRRRIQQYGPRLMKPYAFYDWVPKAQAIIQSRGETPVPLDVEPGGAEFARPSRTFETVTTQAKNPDPAAKIQVDDKPLIKVEMTQVPPKIEPGGSARMHVVFRPSGAGYWNNESGPSVVWLDPPDGWTVTSQYLALNGANKPVSREPRIVEFEIRAPRTAESGRITVPAYVLYYVCEGEKAQCLYRRQNLKIEVAVQ